MFKNIAIISKNDDNSVKDSLDTVISYLDSKKIKYFLDNNSSILLNNKSSTNIDEMKTGMRTTKMAQQENAEGLRVSESASLIRKHTYKLIKTHALTPPVIDLSSAFVYMLVVGGGGYMALSDQFDMDGASIIAFLIGLVIVFDPARNVAQFFTQLQSSLILLESVYSIFDLKAEQLNSGAIYDGRSKPIEIKFENVKFNYNSDTEILKNISMHFKPGTKSAIVGSTGSGKTTVLNLIGRLYESRSRLIVVLSVILAILT